MILLSKIWAHKISIAIACMFFVTEPLLAKVRDNAGRLFQSTEFWAPVNFSDNHVLYLDPFSILKVNEDTFEINLTFIDNLNQYLPDDTFTYRILCSKNKYQKVGWRVNSIFTPYNHWLWKVPELPEQKIAGNYMMATAKDLACGINLRGESLHYLTSYWDGGVAKSGLVQVWMRGEVIDVAETNPYLRRVKIARRFHNSSQFGFEDVYLSCDKREMMMLPEGQGSGEWLDLSLSGGLMRLCLDTPPIGQLRKSALTAPIVQNQVTLPPTSLDDFERIAVESVIDEAKSKCAKLGFVAGTPKFGQCVLKLTQ